MKVVAIIELFDNNVLLKFYGEIVMFMKKFFTVLASASLLFSIAHAEESGLSNEDINKLSETFGHLIGRNIENPSFTFNVDYIIAGIHNAIAGKEAPLSETEYESMIAAIQERNFNEIATQNLAAANSFLENNSKLENVIVLENGKLQYQVLEGGEGSIVKDNSSPMIHYTGRFIDDTIFGSSEAGNEPITLSLDQTIPGFQKGLVGMKKGEKRRLFIHPDMAYGTSSHLPPNSLLIFDVQIIDINNTEKNS